MNREEHKFKLSATRRTFIGNWCSKIITVLFLGVIFIYQKVISPVFPSSCRYTPTCSTYAFTAIKRYGPFRGGFMAVKRILRCHPFHSGGYDPVP